MIVEIKITSASDSSAVFLQEFEVVSLENNASEFVRACIEGLNVELDSDDEGCLNDFSLTGEMNSLFGADWEYRVEAIIVSEDEMDIDEEFDSIEEKYQFCL